MTLPTCAVVCVMHDQAGDPVPGATFEATLNRFEVYESFVVPARVTGTANVDGICTLDLWPNQLGATASGYDVLMRSPAGKSQRVVATIPNQPTVNLHDVSTVPAYPGKPEGQVYIEEAMTASIEAQDAAATAVTAAATSTSAKDAALASQTAAAASATAAAGSATAAEAARDLAIASAFPSGTKMLFIQTSAPVGWTKDTTHNNKALRIVSGAASSGGTVDFTTAFASKSVAGTVGNTTLTIAQMPAHSHTIDQWASSGGGAFSGGAVVYDTARSGSQYVTNTQGGGDAHNHTFTGTAIDLAVKYVDAIIATRD